MDLIEHDWLFKELHMMVISTKELDSNPLLAHLPELFSDSNSEARLAIQGLMIRPTVRSYRNAVMQHDKRSPQESMYPHAKKANRSPSPKRNMHKSSSDISSTKVTFSVRDPAPKADPFSTHMDVHTLLKTILQYYPPPNKNGK